MQCGSADYIDKLIFAWENERGHPGGQSLLVESLTPREIEVLELLATNKTVPEIAENLVLSANTVRTNEKHIYDKLEVNRRFGAVQKAKELKLI